MSTFASQIYMDITEVVEKNAARYNTPKVLNLSCREKEDVKPVKSVSFLLTGNERCTGTAV